MVIRKTKFSIDRALESGTGFLSAYCPINDPLVPLDRLKAFETACADVIELGIKCRTPFADGAIIEDSMQRSTGVGSIADATSAIDIIRGFKHDTLGMIFAYADNNVLASEPAQWEQVDGLLALGSDVEKSAKLNTTAQNHGTKISRFVPYDLPEIDVAAAATATGFVMLQYSNGNTGIRSGVDDTLDSRIKELRAAGVERPILTGIGISTKDQVKHAMDNGADGVVVGSMSVVKGQESVGALEDYLCEIREILNGK